MNTEWKPIASAPKDGSLILLGREAIEDCDAISVPGFWQEGWEDSIDDMGCDSGFVDVQFQEFSGGRSFGSESYRCAPNQPTHWMPLPPAPTSHPIPTGATGGDDIVQRLRDNADLDAAEDGNPAVIRLEREAANEIERLRRALADAPAAGDALDAKRYRWLRDPKTDPALVLDKRTGYVPEDESVPGVGGYHTYEYRAGEELDAAIDAAIAAPVPQQGEV